MAHTTNDVTFLSGPNRVAAVLRAPAELDPGTPSPALVLATPGSSVKEQIGANYARRLADAGFVTLTFDPSHQGQSDGLPRDLEDPTTRVQDIQCAIDLLNRLDVVDDARIGLLGICAGGGYAVRATVIDHRVAALGTVVAGDIGTAMRRFAGSSDDVVATLRAVAAQRSAEVHGAEPRRDPWIPDTPEQAHEAGITDPAVLEAVDFYRTLRGYNEHSTNRLLFRSMAGILTFNAFDLVEELLDQPVQVIVAGRRGSTGSYEDGVRLQRLARNAEDLFVVDDASHYDMYDKPEFVDQAVARLSAFFHAQLAVTTPA
jgi:fermentation-respiration switch protein FrsA (DUF1100 family)